MCECVLIVVLCVCVCACFHQRVREGTRDEGGVQAMIFIPPPLVRLGIHVYMCVCVCIALTLSRVTKIDGKEPWGSLHDFLFECHNTVSLFIQFSKVWWEFAVYMPKQLWMKPITIIAIHIITILNYGISGVEVAQRMFMVSVFWVFCSDIARYRPCMPVNSDFASLC